MGQHREQTVLDLAARPDLGGVPDATREAITALLPRCDTALLHELAPHNAADPRYGTYSAELLEAARDRRARAA